MALIDPPADRSWHPSRGAVLPASRGLRESARAPSMWRVVPSLLGDDAAGEPTRCQAAPCRFRPSICISFEAPSLGNGRPMTGTTGEELPRGCQKAIVIGCLKLEQVLAELIRRAKVPPLALQTLQIPYPCRPNGMYRLPAPCVAVIKLSRIQLLTNYVMLGGCE